MRAAPLGEWIPKLLISWGQGGRRQCGRFRWAIAVQSAQNALRRERRLAKTYAGRIKEGVRNRGSTRDGSGFANPERWLILARQHQHVDLGNFGERDDRIGAPFAARHRMAVEGDLFHQRAARRLDDIAL